MASEIVQIEGATNTITAVCVHRVGDIGVTRDNDRTYWAVTDMPTGICLPFAFDDYEDAIRVADLIDQKIDWRAFVAALSGKDRPVDMIKTVVAIATDFGGCRHTTAPIKPEELARRLSNPAEREMTWPQ